MTRRTLVDRVDVAAWWSSLVSAVLALATVGLIAGGAWMIYRPAGVIAGGLGCAVLQFYFFGDAAVEDVRRRR